MKRACSPSSSQRGQAGEPAPKTAAWEIKRALEEEDSDLEESPWASDIAEEVDYSQVRAREDVEDEVKILKSLECVICKDLVKDIDKEGVETCTCGAFICRNCRIVQKKKDDKDCPCCHKRYMAPALLGRLKRYLNSDPKHTWGW